jgi:hypothetical protein
MLKTYSYTDPYGAHLPDNMGSQRICCHGGRKQRLGGQFPAFYTTEVALVTLYSINALCLLCWITILMHCIRSFLLQHGDQTIARVCLFFIRKLSHLIHVYHSVCIFFYIEANNKQKDSMSMYDFGLKLPIFFFRNGRFGNKQDSFDITTFLKNSSPMSFNWHNYSFLFFIVIFLLVRRNLGVSFIRDSICFLKLDLFLFSCWKSATYIALGHNHYRWSTAKCALLAFSRKNSFTCHTCCDTGPVFKVISIRPVILTS